MSDAKAGPAPVASRQFIAVEVRDGVALVTLDRPPLNVLHTPMLGELAEALSAVGGDPGVAAILLRAAGKAWSAGVDVADHTDERLRPMMERFHAVFRALASTDALTVAAVDGAALGGGCELACACDVVLASDRARFGQPEVKVGAFPPVAAAVLPWRVGVGRAVEINALGATLDAAEAFRIGLVAQVYPAAEFGGRVESYLEAVQALSRPVLRLAKRATVGPFRRQVLAHLEQAERLYLEELMSLRDAREGLSAFMEKRAPVWVHG